LKGNSHSRIFQFFLFGNYYYGICALALAFEAIYQQDAPLPNALFFILLFVGTVVFYNTAYLLTEPGASPPSPRSNWYIKNKRPIYLTQISLIIVLTGGILSFLFQKTGSFKHLHAFDWFLILVFPCTALLYYGLSIGNQQIRLRQIGWLKPFLIAGVWAGLVTLYPLLYASIDNGLSTTFSSTTLFLFVKNFMFISMLSILFDIKDYAMDYNEALKTVVVKLGLRGTLLYVITPMCIVGIISFLLFAQARGFSSMKIFLNLIPFIAVLYTTWHLRARRSIFFYLIAIDGLMILKAVCGICAKVFF
jgi:hypothetical protein